MQYFVELTKNSKENELKGSSVGANPYPSNSIVITHEQKLVFIISKYCLCISQFCAFL